MELGSSFGLMVKPLKSLVATVLRVGDAPCAPNAYLFKAI